MGFKKRPAKNVSVSSATGWLPTRELDMRELKKGALCSDAFDAQQLLFENRSLIGEDEHPVRVEVRITVEVRKIGA